MHASLPSASFVSAVLVVVFMIGLRTAVSDEALQHLITNLSPDAKPISEYFYTGQSVYDGQGNEIGDINDVLLDPSGRVAAVIVGVGGVLGAGEKNLAVSFSAFEVVEKDLESHMVLNMPKETLELAPGFEFDRAKRRWVPAAARLINRQQQDK
jgi:sporulation protein YlmC with PRC-barrel domain